MISEKRKQIVRNWLDNLTPEQTEQRRLATNAYNREYHKKKRQAHAELMRKRKEQV